MSFTNISKLIKKFKSDTGMWVTELQLTPSDFMQLKKDYELLNRKTETTSSGEIKFQYYTQDGLEGDIRDIRVYC